MKEKILAYLKASSDFVSGENISRALSVSRAAVWKCIEELRRDGYQIKAVSRHGYRLTSGPDRLFPAEIACGLKARVLGCRIEHHEALPSTMDEAFRLAMEGAPEGAVVVAETQTKGRGRMGRAWASPKGKGIYCSIILRPTFPPSLAARLTLLTAVAVSEAVEETTCVRPLIKWPNDLLVNGKKLCGILTELRGEMDKVSFMVVGIGLNVNNTATQLLPEATSLRQEKGSVIDRALVLREILAFFEERYFALTDEGYAPVLAEWRKRSATLGKKVRFEIRGREETGIALDIDEDGGLLVRLPSGEVKKHIAGDILL